VPLLRNALSFLTLPILTRYLTPADYGVLNLLTMITTFVCSFFSLNLYEATYRYYFKYQDDAEELKAMFSTVLLTLLVSLGIGAILLMVLFPFLNQFFFHSKMTLLWMSGAFVQMLFMQVNTMNQYLFQNRQEGKAWFQNELLAIAIQIPLSIVLVLTTPLTFEAVILAGLAAEAVKCAILFVRLRAYYALIFKIDYLKEAAVYAWPMLPNMLLGFVYTAFDRTMLNSYKGIAQVGLLDLSNRVTMVLKMFMDGIGSTYSPITLKLLTLNTKESLERLCDLNLKVVALVFFVALGIIAFTQEMVLLLTTPEFHFTMYIVPIYIYCQVFAAISFVSWWLIRFPGKTAWTIPINVAMLLTSLAANIVLIPAYGVIGVAIAALVSSAVSHLLAYVIGLRITPIPMQNGKLFTLLGVLILETALVYILYAWNLNLFLNILAKIGLLSVFAGCCFLLKILSLEECIRYGGYFKKELFKMVGFLRAPTRLPVIL